MMVIELSRREMKRTALSICVALVLGGCRTTDDYYGQAKQYVANTKPNGWDASVFFKLCKPLYERKDSVKFLIGKTKSADSTDRILACMLLNELIDQVDHQPTSHGLAIIQDIRPAELLSQLESMQTNSLSENWSYWQATESEISKKHLGPAHTGPTAHR